jgi:hypothetical protein
MGRKELLLFTDSISIITTDFDINGTGKAGKLFNDLILDAQTLNIIINTFDVYRRTDFNLSDNVGIQQNITKPLRLDLLKISTDTGGQHFKEAFRKNRIFNGLENVYKKSDYVYYLGVYENNLIFADDKEYEVKIEVSNDIGKVQYQKYFRFEDKDSEINMKKNNVFSQYIEGFYGMKKMDSLQIKDTTLIFPYNENEKLVTNIFKIPYDDSTGNRFNTSVRYYNIPKNIERQSVRVWDLAENTAIVKPEKINFVISTILERDSYFYRYVVTNETIGNIKNSESLFNFDDKYDYLSSIVLFGATKPMLNITNFEDKSIEKTAIDIGILKINPDHNPFMYGEEMISPIFDEPVKRDKDAVVMFMYNFDLLNFTDLKITSMLISSKGEIINSNLELVEPEKNFSNGWRRVTLKLPLSKIDKEIKNAKFIVLIKDKYDKEVVSESIDIKIE